MDPVKDVARQIVELFEDLLEEHGMAIPDGDRTGADGEAPIYGCTYGNLVDGVTDILRKNRTLLGGRICADTLMQHTEVVGYAEE